VSPEEVKALRKELGCSSRDLAEAVGVDQKTFLAWEAGSLFPTKKYVDRLSAIREKGPSAVPKRAKRSASPMRVLADPDMWTLVRKVLAHEKLRVEVMKLAASYPDPLEDAD
jgi:DNA-binding XRE family transcriptional regulator